MSDHVFMNQEAVRNTYDPPVGSQVLPFRSYSMSPGEAYIQERLTGAGYGLAVNNQGSIMPSGSGEMALIPETFGLFLKLLFGTNVNEVVGATSAYDNRFYPLDTATVLTASSQVQQVRNGATTTINQKGIEISRVELGFDVGSNGRFTFDYMAQDESPAGVNFGNGDSSIAALTPTYASVPNPFKWTHVGITYGGTPVWNDTTKEFEWTGGTALANVIGMTLSVNLNTQQSSLFGVRTGDRFTRQNRDIELNLTLNNDTPGLTFYNKMRTFTKEAIRIEITHTELADTGVPYKIDIAIPVATYEEAQAGDISGENNPRDLTVRARAEVQAASGYDFGIVLTDTISGGY